MGFKRIVVLSDGTWQTLENATPTHILRLALAIKPEGDDGVQQIMQYDAGVGAEGNLLDVLLGGAFGTGIDQNIIQLYTFLAFNYEQGDEIYLFGFSRGAYTVRSLVGMIHHAGLVRRDHATFVKEAYELYRMKLPRMHPQTVKFRAAHGDSVPVKLLGCFDTVGSLGVPGLAPMFDRRRYDFHNTTVTSNIEHAIHVLSIDEDRKSFEPTLMHEYPEKKGQLCQLYFWGGHAGVGGGIGTQKEPAKLTINFMLDEMERRGIALRVNRDLIPSDYDENAPIPPPVLGDNLIRVLTGSYVRKISSVGELHPSAVRRFLLKAEWRPASLQSITQDILNSGIAREFKRLEKERALDEDS